MSLESLLAQDTVTWQSPTIDADASGGPTYEPYVDEVLDDPARVEGADADQQLRYGILGMHVSHLVLTKRSGIKNGWRCLTSGGEILRVVGVTRSDRMGNIDTFYDVYCDQVLL